MHMQLQGSLGLNLLAANGRQAEHNRDHFDGWGSLCLNVMSSSPGAGKTALLELSLPVLARTLRMVVLEATDIPVVPITTGRTCHLDAVVVARGLRLLCEHVLRPEQLKLLWAENVGNLVCPAEFEVGEHLLNQGRSAPPPASGCGAQRQLQLTVAALKRLVVASAQGGQQSRPDGVSNAHGREQTSANGARTKGRRRP